MVETENNKAFAAKLFNEKELADVVVVIGQGEAQQKFYAHKLVLASVSEVFQNLFYNGGNADAVCDTEGFQILELPDTPEKVSAFALKVIYGVVKSWESKPSEEGFACTKDNVNKVLAFAKEYKIDQLRKFCLEHQASVVLAHDNFDSADKDQGFEIDPPYSMSYGHQMIIRPKEDIFIDYLFFSDTISFQRYSVFTGLNMGDEMMGERFDSDEDWHQEFCINEVFKKDQVYVWNFYPKDVCSNNDNIHFLTQKITCKNCKGTYGDHTAKCPTGKKKVMEVVSEDGKSTLDVLFAGGFENHTVSISCYRME